MVRNASLRCEEVADGGGEMSVEAVLAFNVVAGLIDAANETVLAPVFVVLKELLGARPRRCGGSRGHC